MKNLRLSTEVAFISETARDSHMVTVNHQ